MNINKQPKAWTTFILLLLCTNLFVYLSFSWIYIQDFEGFGGLGYFIIFGFITLILTITTIVKGILVLKRTVATYKVFMISILLIILVPITIVIVFINSQNNIIWGLDNKIVAKIKNDELKTVIENKYNVKIKNDCFTYNNYHLIFTDSCNEDVKDKSNIYVVGLNGDIVYQQSLKSLFKEIQDQFKLPETTNFDKLKLAFPKYIVNKNQTNFNDLPEEFILLYTVDHIQKSRQNYTVKFQNGKFNYLYNHRFDYLKPNQIIK